MGERRRRINRICHWIGVALLVPFVVGAWVMYVQSWEIAGYDERMEMRGAATFYGVVAMICYLASRAVGWFVAELVD